MRMPCANVIDCEGVDSPLSNYSSENPDSIRFFGRFYFETCVGTCTSLISQEDADLCAARFSCEPPNIFYSAAHTCACPDDPSITYTVPAGSFVGFSQAEADALAAQFCQSVAILLCLGPVPELFYSTAQSCTQTCVNGTVYLEVQSHLFVALSQAEADALAAAFVCELATLVCNGDDPDSQAFNAEQQCTVLCPDGSPFTYIVPAGTFTGRNQEEADERAYSYACEQAVAQKLCLSSLTGGCTGAIYSQTLTLSRAADTTAASWAITSGALPPGLSFNPSGSGQSAVISGVPILAGAYSFTVKVTESNGTNTSRSYTVSIVSITTGATLPAGEVGTAYSTTLAQSGDASPVWSVSSGSLPPGLTLNASTGIISGTPTTGGTYNFTISLS